MKNTELRIGNAVMQPDGTVSYVTGMTNGGAVWLVQNPSSFCCAFSISQINPIPLTEEWLVKFGFELNDSSWEIDNGKYVDLQHWGDGDYRHVSNRGCCIAIIETVSQLQNLYFALTGEELTIK